MNVLVTGANGLLGNQVVIELLRRNHNVQIIVRSKQNIHFDLSLVKIFIGNFCDYKILENAAQNCDAIIHIAAVTGINLLHYHDYSAVNVVGARQILKVANKLNINNIVFVSSANTVGYGTEHESSNELFPIEFPFTKSFYAQSKMEAEQLFVEASQDTNKHIIIINPTFMIGAYDTKPSSGKLLIMGYKRWMMFVPKGGKNFVPVNDVSNAVCNALTQGRSGARYLTSGKNLSFREFYELQMRVEGYQQLIIEVPNFIIKAVGKIGDLLRKIGIKTDISTMNLSQLTIREYYSNKKAKDELNFTESDLEVAVLEAIDWFKLNKML